MMINPSKGSKKGSKKMAKAKKTTKKKASKKKAAKKTDIGTGMAKSAAARRKAMAAAAKKRSSAARKRTAEGMAKSAAARRKAMATATKAAARQKEKAKAYKITDKQFAAIRRVKKYGKAPSKDVALLKRAGLMNKDGKLSARGLELAKKIGIPGRMKGVEPKSKKKVAKTQVVKRTKKVTKKKVTKKKVTKKKVTKKKVTKKKVTKKKVTKTAAAKKTARTRAAKKAAKTRRKAAVSKRRKAGLPQAKPGTGARAQKRLSTVGSRRRKGSSVAAKESQLYGQGWIEAGTSKNEARKNPGKKTTTKKNTAKKQSAKKNPIERIPGYKDVAVHRAKPKPGQKRGRKKGLVIKVKKRSGTRGNTKPVPTQLSKKELAKIKREFWRGTGA